MKKIITIIGARPQFIKAATISRALKDYKTTFEEKIIHTGQHFDPSMSDVFFQEMEIPKPHYELNIHGLNHGAMTARMLEGIEDILLKEQPNLLLIYGDTNSTLAGALAGSKLNIPIAHVEAGLRSFNLKMPEEINRIIADRLSTFLFCPTETAIENLKNEGFNNFPVKILKTGDVMLDAALFYEKSAPTKSLIAKEWMNKKFILATIHRQENTDDPKRLTEIFSALNQIHDQIPIILPLHPRTQKKLKEYSLSSRVHIIDPVGYFDMLTFLIHTKMVITDSGGLQKEAYFFKKPCLTLRDETEWVELIDAGTNLIVGSNKEKILKGFEDLQSRNVDFSQNLYGDGQAAHQIIKSLMT